MQVTDLKTEEMPVSDPQRLIQGAERGERIRFGFIRVHQGIRRDELCQCVDVVGVLSIGKSANIRHFVND